MRQALMTAALALIGLPGCGHHPTRRVVVGVGIMDVPAGGGMAQFEVLRDRSMRGGHLSGDPRPFVHQDEGRLDSNVVDSLWALVMPLADSLPPGRPAPAERGYLQLQFDFQVGPPWVFAWRDSAAAPDPRVRAVVAWLLNHKIGGW